MMISNSITDVSIISFIYLVVIFFVYLAKKRDIIHKKDIYFSYILNFNYVLYGIISIVMFSALSVLIIVTVDTVTFTPLSTAAVVIFIFSLFISVLYVLKSRG